MNIKDLISSYLTEEKGYAGAEMHNHVYPAKDSAVKDQQKIAVRKEGDPAVNPSDEDQSKFYIDVKYPGSRMGDPNVEFVGSKDPNFFKAMNLVQGYLKREGKPTVTPGS